MFPYLLNQLNALFSVFEDLTSSARYDSDNL
jgi:hypothetical protein